MKKGIKGRLKLPYNEEIEKNIQDNIEVFKAVCLRDNNDFFYDFYLATYDEEDCYIIDFDVQHNTIKECNADLSLFKKEVYNHFGYKPEQILKMSYDKVF